MLPSDFAANRVLDELGITDISDLQLLDLIAQERNAIVVESPLEGAEARLVVAGGKAIITVASNSGNSQRKRFSIAHELGHLELHRNLGLLKLCTSKDIDDWKTQKDQLNREGEANEFAGALLLPERFFSHLCSAEDPSISYISELAAKFDVSLTATAIRYTRFCYEPIAFVFSRDGYIKWFRTSQEFDDLELRVPIDRKLHKSTRAATFFDTGYLPSGSKTIQASAWLLPGPYHRETTVEEQSIGMQKYNAVLTLLWVNEDLEPEDNSD